MYIAALLRHQRARHDRLMHEVAEGAKRLQDLRSDVGELEQAILQRHNHDQAIGLSTVSELYRSLVKCSFW